MDYFKAVFAKEEQTKDEVFGCFDVGSGITKMIVAKVSAKGAKNGAFYEKNSVNKIEILHERTERVSLGKEVLNLAGEKRLSDKILEQCEMVLKDMAQLCFDNGVKRSNLFGFATHVFRVAVNGDDFLRSMRETLGLDLVLVSQEVEAKVGFATGLVTLTLLDDKDAEPMEVNDEELVVWDSGGGSFQLSAKAGSVVLGALGSTVSGGLLARTKRIPLDASPNPVTMEEIIQLQGTINRCLTRFLDVGKARDILRGKRIIAIGEGSSAFAVTKQLLDAAMLGSRNPENKNLIKTSQVNLLLDELVNKSDDDIKKCKVGKPQSAIPKVCLVREVMNVLDIREFIYCASNGGCLGYMYLKITGQL